MELDGEDEGGEQNSMDIVPVEGELRVSHVISVDVDDGHDDALRGELRVLVESAQVGREGDGGNLL